MPRPAFRYVLLVALFSLVAGCDQLDDNLFTFGVDNVGFTFTFTANEINGNDGFIDDLVSDGTEEILDAIRDQGFGPEEVERVRLEAGSAQIGFLQPPSGEIGLLDDVSVRVRTPGSSESVEVASAEDIAPSGSMVSEADLEVSSENIAPIATAGNFEAVLDLSVDEPLPAGTYRLEVVFDVEVAVSGF